jgi:two-component system response regulator GlrR
VPHALRMCSGTRLAIAKAVIDTPDAVRLRPVATTVLLVDDDPGVRFALTEVLADRGYRVITAGSGAQALNLLDGVDVVVTDLSMPGMDGLELVAQIRARAPGLPVILLTAHGSENMVRIASSRGACGCLSKPFDIDEIAHVIEQVHARRAP